MMGRFPVTPISAMTTDARQQILDATRAALAPLPRRAPYPEYDATAMVAAPRMTGDTAWETFRVNIEAVHGRMFQDIAALAGFLAAEGHRRGYCDPAIDGVLGGALRAAGLEVVTSFERADYDNLAFGITRGTAAIAESGSIVLDDNLTSDRLAALAPWVHVAVLPASAILPTIAEAVLQLGSCPNVIWCTGPSKTADVEGILIEGVHGPGEQIILVLADGVLPA